MRAPTPTQTLVAFGAFAATALAVRRAARTRSVRQIDGAVLLPRFGLVDTFRVFAGVLVPTIAKGVIIRRRGVMAIAEHLDVDRRAVHVMQRLRDRYPPGPVLLGPIAGRRWALMWQPHHVRRVLDESPEPFATKTAEKQAALSHFQPEGSLISHGAERQVRRHFNEEVLDHPQALHRLADVFSGIVHDEMTTLLASVPSGATLTWDRFAGSWFRAVRRIVFGNRAAEDHQLSSAMARLRAHANWAWFWPDQPRLRHQLLDRLRDYLAQAEQGSLARVVADMQPPARAVPEQQIPQWLFAFDPAGMATFRALALIAAHPGAMQQAREEAGAADAVVARELPFLRACVLESLRLWPTTPLLLRETTRPTFWAHGAMPAGTGVIIFAPYFHRDTGRLAFADRFVPEIWLRGAPDERWTLVPFSLGPGACPGRNLVLLTASTALATLVTGPQMRLVSHRRLGSRGPLPGTLNHYALRFRLYR